MKKIIKIILLVIIAIIIIELYVILISFREIGKESSIIHLCLLFQAAILDIHIYKTDLHIYQYVLISALIIAITFLAFKLIPFLY